MVVSILEKKGYKPNNKIYNVFHDYYSRNYLKSYVIRYVDNEVKRNKEAPSDASNPDNYLVFPVLANAIYLTIYSDFEYFLLTLCKMYKKTLNLKIGVEDLKGEGIIVALKYLDRIVSIENVKNNRYYQYLPHWNRVRNYLIHNSSIVDEKCKESVDILELKTAISLNNEIIMMSIDDCKKFVDLTDNLQKYLIL